MAGPAAPALLSRQHALLTLGLLGLALLPRAAASQTAVDPRGRYADVAAALTPTIERLRAQHAIPAISLALVDGSRIVWARGFGWADSAAGVAADAATVYRVGSVSKLFTDIAVMQLVERGELALDAPVHRYLPDFHPTNPFGGDDHPPRAHLAPLGPHPRAPGRPLFRRYPADAGGHGRESQRHQAGRIRRPHIPSTPTPAWPCLDTCSSGRGASRSATISSTPCSSRWA